MNFCAGLFMSSNSMVIFIRILIEFEFIHYLCQKHLSNRLNLLKIINTYITILKKCRLIPWVKQKHDISIFLQINYTNKCIDSILFSMFQKSCLYGQLLHNLKVKYLPPFTIFAAILINFVRMVSIVIDSIGVLSKQKFLNQLLKLYARTISWSLFALAIKFVLLILSKDNPSFPYFIKFSMVPLLQ